jgi:hypothetical protein
MKSLFDPTAYAEISQRLDKLHPETQRQWGKMDVAQMMAHCVETLEVATGNKKLKRMPIGYALGWLVKKSYVSEKPFGKSTPTAPSFMVADAREFEHEKSRLKKILKQFHDGGEASATKHPHAFFGTLTPKQWGETQYKHLDHHLRQFGV